MNYQRCGKMNELPCKKNKCILLPVCKHKVVIICYTLLIYSIAAGDNEINIQFPKLQRIYKDEDAAYAHDNY